VVLRGLGASAEPTAIHALDTQSPAAEEIAVEAKIFGSETAVRVIRSPETLLFALCS
jgi:hypothetical protein